MSSRAALESLLGAELQSGFFTHAFVACGSLSQAEPLYQKSLGPKSQGLDLVYDLASLTKALVTGPLVCQRFEEKDLATRLASPLHGSGAFSSPRWPENLGDLRIGELLAHCSGLPAWWNFWLGHLGGPAFTLNPKIRAERIAEVFSRIPIVASGKDLYSDLGYILLGTWLEAGHPLDLAKQFENWKQRIGLSHEEPFGFRSSLDLEAESFVPSAFCPVRERLLRGEVHDENCASLGGVSGHAGLFGSGPALVRYLQALYQSPEGATYLKLNESLRRSTKHEGLAGLRRGDGGSAAGFAQGQSMGHLGFTGTAFWLHLDSARYGIFLSNRVISGRVAPRMTEVRRQVFGLLHDLCH